MLDRERKRGAETPTPNGRDALAEAIATKGKAGDRGGRRKRRGRPVVTDLKADKPLIPLLRDFL